MLHYIIAGAAFVGILVVFLVISRTLGNIVNQLAKLEYLLVKELERTHVTREEQRLEQEEDQEEKRRQALLAEKEKATPQPPPAPPPAGGKKPPGGKSS